MITKASMVIFSNLSSLGEEKLFFISGSSWRYFGKTEIHKKQFSLPSTRQSLTEKNDCLKKIFDYILTKIPISSVSIVDNRLFRDLLSDS